MLASKSNVVRLISFLFAALVVTTTLAQGQPGSRDHGGKGGIAPLAVLLLNPQVHAALGLNSTQETQWSALQAAEVGLRTQRETAHTNLQALIAAEFADAMPDLVAIENTAIVAQQAMAAPAAAISDQAIALYSSFNTGQQAIVIGAAQAQYQRLRTQF